ncbi:MAG: prepilin-type N-terminal cleavage/methylation domain-containing protein [Patescibacteria group bacterium]
MRKGFTLIELLISISIIALMTTMGLFAITGYNSQKQIKMGAEQLAAKFNLAKTMAFTGQKTKDKVPATYGVAVVATDASKYLLYADFNGNCVYDAGDERVELIALTGSTYITPIAGICYEAKSLGRICYSNGVCTGMKKFYLKSKSTDLIYFVSVDLDSGLVASGELQ